MLDRNLKNRQAKGAFIEPQNRARGARSGAYGHMWSLKGENHNLAVLTEKDVIAIRAEFRRISYLDTNMAELASKFGVSKSNISMIVNGKAWKHLLD